MYMLEICSCMGVSRKVSLPRVRYTRTHARERRQDAAIVSPREAAFVTISTAFTLPLMLSAPALAKGGELGLLEGRTISLVHPIVMSALLATSLWAGWLGIQWRDARTIGNRIRELKKALPPKDEEGNRSSSPLENELAELENRRKQLSQGNFRDRHYEVGSLLLGIGIVTAIGGALNTYLRTGKLFPGPHLYGGAAIVACWALAASLVPHMAQGNDGARAAHIALNTLSVCIFLTQVPTGLEIVGKVLQFTTWP